MSVRKAKYGTPVVLALILASCASTQPTTNSLLGLKSSADAAEARTFGIAKTDDLDAPLRQAQELRLEGNLQGAGTILAQLVLASPDDARVLGEYGKVLAAQGRPDDAIAFLQRSAQLQQNDWTIFSAMGVAYDQKANYKAAKVAYERALLLKPGEPSVLSNAALSRMLAGDLNGAEQMLTQASVDGNDPRIAKNLALVRSLKASAPTQMARATPPKAAPVAPVASVAPAAPVVAAKPAPTPVAANAQAPAKPVARNYELLKNDPTVRMAPIPREEVAAKPAPATKTAQSVPHVLPAPAPQAAAPATKTAATAPAATAAPQPIVKEGAMQIQKTAAKEPPKAAVKPVTPVKAVAKAPAAPMPQVAKTEAKPAPAKTAATTSVTPAPVKAAANTPAAAAKPVVLPAKPKAPDVETAMLRPAVSEVTPEGATAHKNAPPQAQ